MKTISLAAAMLLASTAAYAGGNSYNFEFQGQKIHIEAPRNCSSLNCIQVTAPGLSGIKGLKSGGDDDDVATTTPPAPPAPPAPAPAPVTQTTAAVPQAPVVNYPPPPAPTPVPAEPVLHDVVPGAPQPPAVTPPAPPAPPPVVAAAPPVTQQPVAAPAATANTPIGLWATEDGKGNVKIEQCGANLCGYTTDTHEKILINMKPQDSKWSGQIHDPDSGRTYDSTIAMRGTNLLKVQGCAFGGLFCGGQTWKRIS